MSRYSTHSALINPVKSKLDTILAVFSRLGEKKAIVNGMLKLLHSPECNTDVAESVATQSLVGVWQNRQLQWNFEMLPPD